MRRTPLQPGSKPLQRTSSLPKVSRRRAREQREYAALRRLFLDEHVWCKCGRASEVIQHRQGRGSHYLDVDTWTARCAACERAEHLNPTASYASGDLLKRNSA